MRSRDAVRFGRRIFLLVMAVWFAASAGLKADIDIDGYNSAANDRFANDPAFIARDYDLSGIALASDGTWLTMVSPNVYVSAYHYLPASGSSVTFFGSNDPAGTSLTRTVSANAQRIGSSDLWVGTLDAPLSAQYAYYTFPTVDITTSSGSGPGSFSTSPFDNAEAFVFGLSPSSYPTSQDMAVGRNKLDRWFDVGTFQEIPEGTIGSVIDQSGDANYLQYEAYLQGGDSGGPLMVDNGSGALTLVGINWFVADLSSGESANGYSYLGNYDAEIQAFIDTHAVPEPSTWLLLVTASSLLLGIARQRRRKT